MSKQDDKDLDDLLNEIDSFSSKKPNLPRNDKDQDLDNILGDLCAEMDDSLQTKSNSKYSLGVTTPRIVTSASQRCYPVYLGTPFFSNGLSNFSSSRCCDRLRCTECDFSVMSFDNFVWADSTTYLFLRNNMPDVKKLSSQLLAKSGYRAYGCQCKFYSASDLIDLSALQSFRWVCGKHV